MSLDLERLFSYPFPLNIGNENLTLLSQNTEIGLFSDEFEDKKTIKFIKVGYDEISKGAMSQSEAPYFKLYNPNGNSGYDFFGITFVNHNGFSYIDVALRGSEIALALGDYIIVLFEDGTKEKYTFKRAASGNRYLSSNIIALTTEDLLVFLTKDIDKVKVVSVRKNIYCIYGLNEKDDSSEFFKYKYTGRQAGQQLLKYMAYRFIDFNLQNKI